MADTAGGTEYEEYLRETVEGAAHVLTDAFGRPVGLDLDHNFRPPGYRATVLRCRVLDHSGQSPSSVIVKRFLGDYGVPYDHADADPRGARARLLNEWTGLSFLQTVESERPFGPRLYGGDGDLGLVVLEDLGEGECLADFLQGNDPVQAERALLTYAATLGRMHSATAGREERYAALHHEWARGGADPAGERMVRTWLTSGPAAFREACAALDLSISAAVEDELATLTEVIDDPGPFLAFSVGDTCPDNHRYVRSDPDYLRFYDMEFGGFQHALLDAAYLWMPFPTCWCVARLPGGLPARLESAYRAELVRGCPVAAEDATFHRAMAEACATWFILTVAWQLTGALEQDDQWGISTVRQRFALRAGNFVRVADRAGHLPALTELARQFTARILARWGEEADMPLYQPFRR